MEITVISAQGLKNSSYFPISRRLRPFITITTYPTAAFNGGKSVHEYRTRIDDQGGVNPTWGDKFYVPIDASFFANRYSCVFLELYTKRLIVGKVFLGWCQIPVSDIGFPTQKDTVRYLNYRLRDRDGTRGQGIVSVAIKLTGFQPGAGQRWVDSDYRLIQHHQENAETVIGIPVLQNLNLC